MEPKRRKNKLHKFSILLPLFTVIGIGVTIIIFTNYEKSWSFNWNGIRKNIKDSIAIAEIQGITSGVVGYSGTSTRDEIMRRKWIMSNATEEELLKLIEYPSGTVKAIAYEGLIKKEHYDEKAELISKSISDNEFSVYYQSGCIGSKLSVSEYLMRFVINIDNSYTTSQRTNNNYGLTELEKNKILIEYHNSQN